jgi:hypothetical protein
VEEASDGPRRGNEAHSGGLRGRWPGDDVRLVPASRARRRVVACATAGSERIVYPEVWNRVVVVTREDDDEARLNHALIQGRRPHQA